MKARTHQALQVSTRSTWQRLRFLLGDRPRQVAYLVLVSVLAGLFESAILTVVAQAAAALVDGVRSVHVAVGPLRVTESLGTLLVVALGLALVRLALMAPASILPATMAANVQARLRLNLFSAFTQASWTTQARDREGHLQELLTNQVGQATSAALQAAQCVTAGITLLVLIVSALLLNALGALFVLVAALVLFAVLRPLNELGSRHARSLSQAGMDFASRVGEATRLAEETFVFGVASAQRSRINAAAERSQGFFFRTQMFGNLVPNIYRGLIYLIVVGGLIALNAAHPSHVASLGAVVLLLVRAGGYGQALQGSYALLRQAMPYVDRVEDAQRRYLESSSPNSGLHFAHVDALTFDDVSFAYVPGRPVLAHLSFAVSAGEAIGIVGPSGAGKSTLVQILLGLRTASGGEYRVNGMLAEQLDRADWHAKVAFVAQEPRLLHASVADNIRYFRDLSDADVRRAAEIAHIHGDIERWAEGYQTLIGPRADAISGGSNSASALRARLPERPRFLSWTSPRVPSIQRPSGYFRRPCMS